MSDFVIPPAKIRQLNVRYLQVFYLVVLGVGVLYTFGKGAPLALSVLTGLYVATFSTIGVALGYALYTRFQNR